MNADIERFRSVLAELVEIRSFTGEVSPLIERLRNRLEKLGYQVIVGISTPEDWSHDVQGSPPLLSSVQQPEYIIAYPPIHQDSNLLLFAHYDTENYAETPTVFNLTEDETKFYGHGIADDKAGIAAILLTIENLNFLGCKKFPAVVFAQAKQGGCFGMSKAISKVKNRIAAVYAHPAESNKGFSQIKTASRGIATFSLEFKGKLPYESEENTPASADPRQGQSAILLASQFILNIQSWNDPDIVWLASEIVSKNKNFQVPMSCEVLISTWFRRFGIQEVSNILIERLTLFAAKLNLNNQFLPKIIGLRANPAVALDQEFIESIKNIIAEHTSEAAMEYDWHAASDIRFPILHLGIPAVGLGCIGGGFYGGIEWINKSSFQQFTDILTNLSKDFA